MNLISAKYHKVLFILRIWNSFEENYLFWIFYSFIWKHNLNLLAFLNKLYEENILDNPYWCQQSITRFMEFLLYLKKVLKRAKSKKKKNYNDHFENS